MYSSVIVCGCTKNSASYIQKHLQLLYDMAPLFSKFKMLIYENDSTDNTVEILEQFKKSHANFDYISENGTRIVGNQKGKLKDKITDYYKDFVIQI